ncbi:MAG: hypothetical protein LCH70_11300 [Proteobacteria bacterium]|nr:hypothetical protein [Pseudomonadota bacterium]
MTTPAPDQPAHPPDHGDAVLRIVSGLHVGATRPLARREMILVGSGDDCDVVLADAGVAAHHALLNVVDGRFHLRALDAAVDLPDRTLHPGDPVEVARVQRVGLGEAAIAFGPADAPEWLLIAPDAGGADGAPPRRTKVPFTSRLPMIAGVAVLALAGLAIAAALMPAKPPQVDAEQRLRQLAQTHRVSDAEISRDVDGRAVLSGTVDDRATRERLRAQVEAESLPAAVNLRTGEDLAGDVGEVMRAAGFPVRSEYLGDNNVRVTGQLGGDETAVRAFIVSRAVRETGVNRVEMVNLDAATTPDEGAPAADAGRKVRIVSIVRGDAAHVLADDGEQYRPGDVIPGWGELVSIGQHAHVLQPDGLLVKLTPQPAPPAEPASDANAQDAPASPRTPPAATQVAPRAPTRTTPSPSPVHKPESTTRIQARAIDADAKPTSPAVNPRSRSTAMNIRYSPDRGGWFAR